MFSAVFAVFAAFAVILRILLVFLLNIPKSEIRAIVICIIRENYRF